jgi:hypothetical protein
LEFLTTKPWRKLRAFEAAKIASFDTMAMPGRSFCERWPILQAHSLLPVDRSVSNPIGQNSRQAVLLMPFLSIRLPSNTWSASLISFDGFRFEIEPLLLSRTTVDESVIFFYHQGTFAFRRFAQLDDPLNFASLPTGTQIQIVENACDVRKFMLSEFVLVLETDQYWAAIGNQLISFLPSPLFKRHCR